MSSTASPERATVTTAPRGTRVGMPAQNRVPTWLTGWLFLLLALVVTALYVSRHLNRGWVPHDEGALAEGALRLMRGELPHRDFNDVYTGGLDYLNSWSFGIFGTTLVSIRLMLFMVMLAWVPAVYYIASRLVRPPAATVVTLLAVVWSVPNYPAAMPSWYNLFLATFGAAAVFRYLETSRRRWLVAAGLAGGLSFLVKVIGLYYVGGVLLLLVFHSHALARTADSTRRSGTVYAAFVTLSLLAFVAALIGVVRRQAHPAEIAQFVIPGALIAGLLARNEWTQPAGISRERFAALARLLLPFSVGVALPVTVFLIPYARSGSVTAFATGVFVLPIKRLGFAAWPAPKLITALALVPVVAVVTATNWLRVPLRGWRAATVLATATLLVIVTARYGIAYRAVWYALRNLLPLIALVGVAVLSQERAADAREPLLRARTMTLLCVTALAYVVQFPFAAPTYFCYVAPLIALLSVAMARYARTPDRIVFASMLGFLIVFGVVLVNGSTIYRMGETREPYPQMVELPLERGGGLQVTREDAAEYAVLGRALRERARGGYTWASPDCPEIYFLSGLRNPTPSLFEFFEDSVGRSERVLQALTEHDITAIVLNQRPAFSPRITMSLYEQLERRYPFHLSVGRFELRWRS